MTDEEPEESAYLEKIYESSRAQAGGVIYRAKDAILRNVTYDELRDSVYDKSFHLLETTTLYIIVCNTDPIKLHC